MVHLLSRTSRPNCVRRLADSASPAARRAGVHVDWRAPCGWRSLPRAGRSRPPWRICSTCSNRCARSVTASWAPTRALVIAQLWISALLAKHVDHQLLFFLFLLLYILYIYIYIYIYMLTDITLRKPYWNVCSFCKCTYQSVWMLYM